MVFMDIINWCNLNSGFVSMILSLITIVLSLFAIIVAICAARLPYKQNLMIYPAVFDDDNDIPEVHILLVNVGNSPIYITSIVLEHSMCNELALGYIPEDNLDVSTRIIGPYVQCSYIVPMQNYNYLSENYHLENYPFKIIVETTKKKYSKTWEWYRG